MVTKGKQRKALHPEEWKKFIEHMVHFNSKTQNSNASVAAVRLTRDDALELPYLSLRTILGAASASIPLDVSGGGAGQTGRVKEIYWVLGGNEEANQVLRDEKSAIAEGMQQALKHGNSVGTELIDHRLRQLLIPKADAPNGYFSMTPLTSTGLCVYLFHKDTGVVTRHNAMVEKTSDGSTHKLRQARFGVGGEKPNNTGYWAHYMQHPLLLESPRPSAESKKAFAIYHTGVHFSSERRFQGAVKKYADFLKEKVAKPWKTVTLSERGDEKRLVAGIATVVLVVAAEAEKTLWQFADKLPQEEQLPDTSPPEFALVSPKLKPAALRGLLDSRLRLRDDGWPRGMAAQIMDWMEEVHEHFRVLDAGARRFLESLLEDNFR